METLLLAGFTAALDAKGREQLSLLERPRPLAVQNRRTKALADRAALPALVSHWHSAGQDRLECQWSMESIAGTGALRALRDNDQTTVEARMDSVRVRVPAPQERIRRKGCVVDFRPRHQNKPSEHNRKTEDEFPREDALVLAIGLLLLAVAVVTYLY
jgi:hypothetical protein